MGSCSARAHDDVADDVCGSSHELHAPMWVAKVQDVLEMTGRFRPHQNLKDEGLVVPWSPTMFTIFVSHQWLSLQHPDPDGVQLQVLQSILRKLIAKQLKIENDAVMQYNGRRMTGSELARVQGAYIWLDYFCVPQNVEGHAAPGLMEEQLLYVHSIPRYVDHCNVFVALVPKAMHSNTGTQCSFHSWLARGWCRTECWCYFLSAGSKIPIVVVKSHDVAQFKAPFWHQHPVYSGDFAIEKDRASCCQVLQVALEQHLLLGSRVGNL